MICLFFAILTPAVILAQQRYHNSLPSPSLCGILRESQLYNLQKTVEYNEFPWIAKLLDVNEKEKCLSVLISKQYLLAPAHIFDFETISTIELGRCRNNHNCKVRREELDTFVQHPQHVKYMVSDDIALVRMKQPVTFTDYIQPICLPSSDDSSIDYVAQYHTFTGQQELGRRIGKSVVLIMRLRQCQQIYIGLEVNDNVLCANTCDNGSKYNAGSMLMGISVKNSQPDHYFLLGLLSVSFNACQENSTDIFQRIDRYMDWIVENIARLEGS